MHGKYGTTTRVCSRCLMDETASGISFDAEGFCNFCTDYLNRTAKYHPDNDQALTAKREKFIERIRLDGKGKEYDCIVGVSGGVDSSYALYLARESGLRPLAVHMDNGWDSELAAANIQYLVRGLDVDLFTYVIDWEEYRNLMQAFFNADVIDIELLYDNAMLAVNYSTAAKHGIKWILAGSNTATEGIRVPENWTWFKRDKKNILAIAKSHNTKIKTFPAIGTLNVAYYDLVKKIRWMPFLDYFNYQRSEALNTLTNRFGYKPYPYKHYESIFTRFYQGYLLPKKFGVDKRKAHLSALVLCGEMSREEGLRALEQIPYPSERELKDDIDYFLKKMHWSASELTAYLQRPEVAHDQFPSEKALWDASLSVYRTLLEKAVKRIKF